MTAPTMGLGRVVSRPLEASCRHRRMYFSSSSIAIALVFFVSVFVEDTSSRHGVEKKIVFLFASLINTSLPCTRFFVSLTSLKILHLGMASKRKQFLFFALHSIFCIFGFMNEQTLSLRLTGLYPPEEARAIVLWVLEERFGLSWADVLCGKVNDLSAEKGIELEKIMRRLEQGEPVQYVLGASVFCGRKFNVDSRVLIPRPETEELVKMVVADVKARETGGGFSMLDIGTGSGCIAVSLKLKVDDAIVEAWDVSSDALQVAKGNAKRLDADVIFHCQDALAPPDDRLKWDYIVSNPPYICEEEAGAMHRNVLEHEPYKALFVSDNTPLLFYEAIAGYAVKALKPQGRVYMEINPRFTDELQVLFSGKGFASVSFFDDQFGKQRFLCAML